MTDGVNNWSNNQEEYYNVSHIQMPSERDKRRNLWEYVVVVILCSIWIGHKKDDSIAASENGEDRGLEVV